LNWRRANRKWRPPVWGGQWQKRSAAKRPLTASNGQKELLVIFGEGKAVTKIIQVKETIEFRTSLGAKERATPVAHV
jgi:hypothetical protein